jgi:hypothetical protein
MLPALLRAAAGRLEREVSAAERRFGPGASCSCRPQAWAASITAAWSKDLRGREVVSARPSSFPK